MQRRKFLQGMLVTAAGITAPEVFALSFEEYKKLQNSEFSDYQAKFRAAQLVYQQEIKQHWLEAKLTSQTTFVRYSADLQVRSTVDFEAGTVTLEAQGASPADAGQKIKQEVSRLMALDTQAAYEEDSVLRLVDRDQVKINAALVPKEPIVGDLLTGKTASEILEPASKSIEEDRRPVAKVVIQLPKGSTAKKAERYQALAERYAGEQKISAALVMAVMHTESFFNPFARSYVPAFGLMQIVPQSAGMDTTAYLDGESRLLTPAELYQPEINIRSGAAYLHILYYRYLKAIEHPASRFYCTIAAYNTGAGNVARAFTGYTSVSRAAVVINRLQPDQVLTALMGKLPYQETRDYVEKVVSRVALYRA